MKRFISKIAVLLLVSLAAHARDIQIDSWTQLCDQVLRPDDRIMFCAMETETFQRSKEKIIKPSEQIEVKKKNEQAHSFIEKDAQPRLIIPREQVMARTPGRAGNNEESVFQKTEMDSATRLSEENSDMSHDEQQEQESKEPEVVFVESPTTLSDADAQEACPTVVEIYCIEEDSWWNTRNRDVKNRRLVVVPEKQKDAYWRDVLVVTYPRFWDGYKYAQDFSIPVVSEEYRFSRSFQVAGILGASLVAGAFLRLISR